jgi:hypothetical protein
LAREYKCWDWAVEKVGLGFDADAETALGLSAILNPRNEFDWLQAIVNDLVHAKKLRGVVPKKVFDLLIVQSL